MGRYLVCVSGASGAVYAKRCIEALLAGGEEVYCVFSYWALDVFKTEIGESVDSWLKSINFPEKNKFDANELFAPPASGSWLLDGTVVVPCSMASLGAIANAAGTNLIHRAASVALKEARPLVIVPRETPLSLIDLRNMTSLAEAGAAILPACPAFYQGPESLDDIINFVCGKILDRLLIKSKATDKNCAEQENKDLFTRWKGRSV